MLFFDDLVLFEEAKDLREKVVSECDYYENESFCNGRTTAILEAISEAQTSEIWN